MLETPHVLAILVGYAYGLCLVVFRISESVPRWWRVGATNSSYLNPPLVHSSAIFLSDYTYIICLLLSTSYARMVIYYLLHAAHMVLDFTYGVFIKSSLRGHYVDSFSTHLSTSFRGVPFFEKVVVFCLPLTRRRVVKITRLVSCLRPLLTSLVSRHCK